MELYTSKETTFRDYLRACFKHKIVFIIVPIALMIPVYIALELKTPVYQASVKMLVLAQKKTEAEYYEGIFAGEASTKAHVEMVKSKRVVERVVKALKLYQRPIDYERQYATRLKTALIDRRFKKLKLRLEKMPPEQRQAVLYSRAVGVLRGSIDAMPLGGTTSLFKISVRDFNPEVAAILANSVSRSYVIFDLEQQVAELELKYGEKHSTVKQLKKYIEEIEKTLHGKPLPDIEAMGPANVKIVGQAEVRRVRGVNKFLLRSMAFFASIFISIMLAFGFEYFDQTFKSPQDIETFLNIRFLGSIPKIRSKGKLLMVEDPKPATDYSRSYQNLSSQIHLLMRDKNLKSLLITDAESSKDTTTVIANLGIQSAHEAGHKVLIIDANLRNPLISKTFNTSNSPGLADVLEEKTSFEDAIQDLGSNLYILPAGETELNPITLLDSSFMSDVIKKAKEKYEVVFVNCADLKNFTDTIILSSTIDSIALVINEGRVKRYVVKSAIAPLQQKKANIIGAILNNRKYVIPKIIYKLT